MAVQEPDEFSLGLFERARAIREVAPHVRIGVEPCERRQIVEFEVPQ
jgi:hypothetical protein